MPAQELYVISDLHLCDGSKTEDFQESDDLALSAFVDQLATLPEAALLINGDFIDFVQIQPNGACYWYDETLDCSEAQSLEKLECAMSAHAPVFDALARFVSSGHLLRFHLGNHDIDLVWPRVRERIRERLGQPADSDLVTFGEALKVGGVYIEHGHQADLTVNGFPNQPNIIHRDPDGVLRLERCWGTRFVEEFYNKIESLDGCDKLDNVRPRMKAATIIIKHAIFNSDYHPVLKEGLRLILSALVSLKTEADFDNAASEMGVPRAVLTWLVKVARWFGVQPLQPKGVATGSRSLQPGEPQPPGGLSVPSLQAAYEAGAEVHSAEELAAIAPVLDAPAASDAPGAGDRGLFGFGEKKVEQNPEEKKSVAYVASKLASQHPDAQAFCLGHTHISIASPLEIPGTGARYYNSGSWTLTLNLDDLSGVDFAYLQDASHYRQGRDYLRISWPEQAEQPRIEALQWRD